MRVNVFIPERFGLHITFIIIDKLIMKHLPAEESDIFFKSWQTTKTDLKAESVLTRWKEAQLQLNAYLTQCHFEPEVKDVKELSNIVAYWFLFMCFVMSDGAGPVWNVWVCQCRYWYQEARKFWYQMYWLIVAYICMTSAECGYQILVTKKWIGGRVS